jgi:hypothetical protein
MNDIIITPANIISIVFQYKPNNTYPQGLFSNPSIVIAFDNNGVTQYQQIDLNQVLTYIKMLELKAAINAIGEVVIAVQSTPDGEQFTKISIGEPVVPPPVTGTINFKVGGVDFDITNNLINLFNITGAGVATRGIDNTPFLASFELPKFSNIFTDDYSATSDLSDFWLSAVEISGHWSITITGKILVNGTYHIGFTALVSGVALITVNTPSGLHDSDFTPIDSNISNAVGNVMEWLQNEGGFTFLLPKINGNFWQNDYVVSGANIIVDASDSGANWLFVIVQQGVPLTDSVINITAKPLVGNMVAFMRGNPGFVINSITMNTQWQPIAGATGYIDQSGSAYPALVQPLQSDAPIKATSLLRLAKDTAGVKNGSLNVDVTASSATDVSVFAFGKSFIQTVVSIGTTGNYDIPFTYEPTDEGDIFLIFNNPSTAFSPAPPLGIAVNAAADNTGTSASLCPAALVGYFTDDGTITTGKTVYTDAALTTPLAGSTFILSPDGNIYAINVVTGVVGAVSGNSCAVPITGKNMFVLNIDGGEVDVDSTPYIFPAGTNYNTVIKSNSSIVNASGFTKVFSFYKQAPFIPANYTAGSGSPVTVLSGNNVTLPNNIADYNYMKTNS